MAVIKSGAGTDQLTIDATSKAARVTLYDVNGVPMTKKATHRAGVAGGTFAAVAGTAPFFLAYGSASKVVVVQRVVVSGLTLTTVQYLSIGLVKYSTLHSGGTVTNLTQVPLDANSSAGSLTACAVFIGAPTPGTSIGTIGSRRVLAQATTAAAGGLLTDDVIFDFRSINETSGVVLRGTGSGIGLLYQVAPASVVATHVEIEWTEE